MSLVSNHCTSDHCIYPYDPEIQKPKFDILDSDTEEMKQAKKLWNSSEHECHPNYMSGLEKYRILKNYDRELKILQNIWEEKAKHEPGIFSLYYDQIKSGEKEAKRIQEGDIPLPPEIEKCFKCVKVAAIIGAIAVSIFAIFFPLITAISLPFGCYGAAKLLRVIYPKKDPNSVEQNNQ